MTAKTYYVGDKGAFVPVPAGQLDRDPRGIVWIFEPPVPNATYVMGIDPTYGIPNWDRTLRTSDDYKTDNGAIEIVRVAREGPDAQVCEYAAPIDPEDLADVANALGRMYAGNGEDGQCLCILEVYPGPGLLTLRRMLNTHGYTNQWVWPYLDKMDVRPTGNLGWYATAQSVKYLWVKGSKHIVSGRIKINSPHLVEEMQDVDPDPVRMTAKAGFGVHDDRLRAIMLCTWAGHHWTFDVETKHVEVRDQPRGDYQETDCTVEEMMEMANEQLEQMLDND